MRRAIALAACAAILQLASLPSGTRQASLAATPASGTLSPTTPTLTYTGGPFFVPNPTPETGVQCNDVLQCDDFALTLSGTDATTTNLTVKIQWPNTVADFDLYVLDASGKVIGQSATSRDPEIVVVTANPGSYTVRAVPFLPLGETYTGTLALTAKPPAPPPGGGNDEITYQNYAAPDGLGTRAGEPSIGVNWNTGRVFIQALTETLRVTFDDSVSPATALWEDKSAHLPKCTAVTSLDPILFTDSQTGRTFESQLIVNPILNSLTCYTDDDGETWTPTTGGGPGQGIDHQTIGGGPYAAGDALRGTATYPHVYYYCSQHVALANCAVSRDGGVTFGPAIPVYNLTQCGGLHGHVKVSRSGTTYVPDKNCVDPSGARRQAVVVSDDALTWSVRSVPNSHRGQSDPSVGIGGLGSVYFGYQDWDPVNFIGRARVAVSRDKGKTWRLDQDVGAALGIQNVAFPAVVAGDDDRAAFAFLGTTTAGDYQAAGFTGVWHLYVAHTIDGGLTWTTVNATPNDPVQRGCIWLGGGSNSCRNLLDFMDAAVDAQGRVLVGFADGCTLECVGNPNAGPGTPGYRTQLATIARQDAGPRLFAEFD